MYSALAGACKNSIGEYRQKGKEAKKRGDYMTLLDKEQKINQINEKLSVMGSKELLIVHTTIMTLYLRQQFDQCNQLLPEFGMEPAAEPPA
jgi:hypothetical protein